jgi:hypothetical protein
MQIASYPLADKPGDGLIGRKFCFRNKERCRKLDNRTVSFDATLKTDFPGREAEKHMHQVPLHRRVCKPRVASTEFAFALISSDSAALSNDPDRSNPAEQNQDQNNHNDNT